MADLTVATTQFELRAETSLAAFLEHMEHLVQQAAERGAEVVLFPELASTGLLAAITSHQTTTQTITADYREILSVHTDAIVDAISVMSQRYDIVVVGGSHNRVDPGGTLRNTAYVAHPDGRVQAQDKIHLTPQEHTMAASGGDELLITQIGAFTAGVLICADIQFPELARYLVHKGVDLIFCPSLTWNRRGIHRVYTGCQARAIENQLYVVLATLVGSSGLPADAPLYAVGTPTITGPVDKTIGINDGVIARGQGIDGDELVIATLSHDLLLASRAKPEAPGLQLQRPDFYAKLQAEISN
jgi:predicted amidohydrolase